MSQIRLGLRLDKTSAFLRFQVEYAQYKKTEDFKVPALRRSNYCMTSSWRCAEEDFQKQKAKLEGKHELRKLQLNTYKDMFSHRNACNEKRNLGNTL